MFFAIIGAGLFIPTDSIINWNVLLNGQKQVTVCEGLKIVHRITKSLMRRIRNRKCRGRASCDLFSISTNKHVEVNNLKQLTGDVNVVMVIS